MIHFYCYIHTVCWTDSQQRLNLWLVVYYTVHLLNQFPLTHILWRSLTSLSTWAALLTPLATPVLIFFDDSDLHPQWWSDGPVRPSLGPESTESRHQAEKLHYVCPGGRPLWCRNSDAVKGRLTKATGIPHDMPKVYHRHQMERLHHQQSRGRYDESPEHTQHHSRPSSFRLWPHPSPVRQHTSTQGAKARRECQVRRHSTSRLESPRWPTTDLMD